MRHTQRCPIQYCNCLLKIVGHPEESSIPQLSHFSREFLTDTSRLKIQQSERLSVAKLSNPSMTFFRQVAPQRQLKEEMRGTGRRRSYGAVPCSFLAGLGERNSRVGSLFFLFPCLRDIHEPEESMPVIDLRETKDLLLKLIDERIPLALFHHAASGVEVNFRGFVDSATEVGGSVISKTGPPLDKEEGYIVFRFFEHDCEYQYGEVREVPDDMKAFVKGHGESFLYIKNPTFSEWTMIAFNT
jgi:hypothetical protein